MKILKQSLLLAQKDILIELKSKQMVPSMLIFSLTLIVIFSFAFNPAQNDLKMIIPGLIWVLTVFTGMLGLGKTFQIEKQNRSFFGLVMAPIHPMSIFIGKFISNLFFIIFVQLIAFPFLYLLFDLRWYGNFPFLILIIFLGTFGFICIGTFLSTLVIHTKGSDLLLPIFLFPLIIPIVIAAVRLTSSILYDPNSLVIATSWFKLLVGFDVIFFVLSLLLVEYVLEV